MTYDVKLHKSKQKYQCNHDRGNPRKHSENTLLQQELEPRTSVLIQRADLLDGADSFEQKLVGRFNQPPGI